MNDKSKFWSTFHQQLSDILETLKGDHGYERRILWNSKGKINPKVDYYNARLLMIDTLKHFPDTGKKFSSDLIREFVEFIENESKIINVQRKCIREDLRKVHSEGIRDNDAS